MNTLIQFLADNLNEEKLTFCDDVLYQDSNRSVCLSVMVKGLKSQSEKGSGYFKFSDFSEDELIEKVKGIIELNK
jgi:hypothetical protein